MAQPAAADDDAQTKPGPTGQPHVCNEDYPAAAIRANAEGVTLLEFTVTQEGAVADLKVGKSSGNADLDKAAIACASKWRYKPATLDGKAVASPWKANVDWRIMPSFGVTMMLAECMYLAAPNRDWLRSFDTDTSLSFRVQPDGAIADVKITNSSGNTELDALAMKCLSLWRYDTSLLILPHDGVPGHFNLNWHLAASLMPKATPKPAQPSY